MFTYLSPMSLIAMTSVDEEISAIERSAAGENDPRYASYGLPSSRVASMGSVQTYESFDRDQGDFSLGSPMKGVSPPANGTDGGPSGAKQRNSIVLNPVSMRGLACFDDSDFEDSDDDEDEADLSGKKPAQSSAKHALPKVPNPKATGGPDHRPLVGGFAAAAYEAARADYYKKQGLEVRTHNPPRPRPHYPGYP